MIFTVLVLVVVGAAVWDARQWEIKARLFPWSIGIPIVGLTAILLVTQIVRLVKARRTDQPHAGVSGMTEAQFAVARRRAISIVGWLLGFLAAIWVLGFPVGGTLGTLGYLRWSARESWRMTLAISAGTAVFFMLMDKGLHTPFPPGTLFEILSPG